jgi:hypothetical protein
VVTTIPPLVRFSVADFAPPVVGENTIVVAHAPPGASEAVVAQGGLPVFAGVWIANCVRSGPESDCDGGATAVVPVLVMVTIMLALNPTIRLPNATGFGLALKVAGGLAPVPVSGTVMIGVPAEVRPMLSDAVFAPADVGANRICTAQAAPTPTSAWAVQGGLVVAPPFTNVNCEPSGLERPGNGDTTGSAPVLVKLIVIVAFAPTATLPNAAGFGLALNDGFVAWPVPVTPPS